MPSTTSITDIKASCMHSSEKIAKLIANPERPTKVEVQDVMEHFLANLCNLPNTDGVGKTFGWAIIITTPSEWLQSELLRINEHRANEAEVNRANDNAAAVIANEEEDNSAIEYEEAFPRDCDPLPVFENPGPYIVNSTNSEKQILISKINHEIKQSLYASYVNIEAAQQQIMREVFPETLLADMNISNNSVANKTTSLKIRLHVETKFNKLLPSHISDVMDRFNQPPKDNEPLGNYFEKQNKCSTLLQNSAEPISLATKKRTARGHFLKILNLQKGVSKFDKDEEIKEKTWNETRTYFVDRDLEYKDNQDSLSQAGIANSATTDVVVNDQIQQLQTALSSVMAKQEQSDSHIMDIATAMSSGKENSPPLAPAYAPPSTEPVSDLQQILAAITNSTKPAPTPKPKTELQQILAFLTTGARGGGGGGGQRATRSSKVPTLRHRFYCWSHGVNVSHDSCDCKKKKPGHQDTATYCNQMGGYKWCLERWHALVNP